MLAAAVWRRQGHGVRRLCSGRLFDEHPFVQRGRLEDPTSPRFSRVVISPTHRALHEETVFALLQMRTALEMREKYRGANPVCQPSEEQTPRVEDLAADGKAFDVECRDGVFVPVGDVALEEAVARIPTVAEYHSDLMWLWGVCKSPVVEEVCVRRLNVLELNHDFYINQNSHAEYQASKMAETDFWATVKVDNHIHAASISTNAHLLEFMQRSVEEDADAVVMSQHGPVTLRRMMEEKGLLLNRMSANQLNVHKRPFFFRRFDHFNRSFAPAEDADLRDAFLKPPSPLFAKLVHEVAAQSSVGANLTSPDAVRAPAHVAMEPRFSVYGRAMDEWSNLAAWWKTNGLDRITSCKFMVQFPRLLHLHRAAGHVDSFQDMLDNLFKPLFDVTADPSVDPVLHEFLLALGGIDTVDDESAWDVLHFDASSPPSEYTSKTNPVYSQFAYYFYANIASVNVARASRGLNTLPFRPHCGEAGAAHHLATGWLVADGVNHGINLRHSAPMQYLYYLAQVPLAVSLASNNALFVKLADHPFEQLFKRGLRVALSTDDPLQLHTTCEPLLEEFSLASAVWNLSSIDLAELAVNSVRASSFPPAYKASWLGADWDKPGTLGNDIHKTNCPNIRVAHREECLRRELHLVARASEAPLRQPSGVFPIANPVCDGTWRADEDAIKALAELGVTDPH